MPMRALARLVAALVAVFGVHPAAAQAPLSVEIARTPPAGWSLALAAPFTDATATLTIDGRKAAEFSGRHQLAPLSPGVHRVEVQATEPAGRVASQRLLLREARRRSPSPVLSSIEVDIIGTRVSAKGAPLAAANTIRVSQGDLIRLQVTADSAISVHLHGYDMEAPVAPGAPAVFVFEAELAGRFAVERHGGREVRLFFLEVHPK